MSDILKKYLNLTYIHIDDNSTCIYFRSDKGLFLQGKKLHPHGQYGKVLHAHEYAHVVEIPDNRLFIKDFGMVRINPHENTKPNLNAAIREATTLKIQNTLLNLYNLPMFRWSDKNIQDLILLLGTKNNIEDFDKVKEIYNKLPVYSFEHICEELIRKNNIIKERVK